MTDTIDPNRGTIGGAVREHIASLENEVATLTARLAAAEADRDHARALLEKFRVANGNYYASLETERIARKAAEDALREVKDVLLGRNAPSSVTLQSAALLATQIIEAALTGQEKQT